MEAGRGRRGRSQGQGIGRGMLAGAAQERRDTQERGDDRMKEEDIESEEEKETVGGQGQATEVIAASDLATSTTETTEGDREIALVTLMKTSAITGRGNQGEISSAGITQISATPRDANQMITRRAKATSPIDLTVKIGGLGILLASC